MTGAAAVVTTVTAGAAAGREARPPRGAALLFDHVGRDNTRAADADDDAEIEWRPRAA